MTLHVFRPCIVIECSDFGSSFSVQYTVLEIQHGWVSVTLYFMYPAIELWANKTSQGKQTVLPFIDPAARIYRTKYLL